MTRCLILLPALVVGLVSSLTDARADHALEFYPSYYPHEIRVETVTPASAATLLSKNSIHAYVGGDPFGRGPVPANLGTVESLGSYLVVTFKTTSGPMGDRNTRCATGGKLVRALAAGRAPYVFHPYPVTPYHADYLQHFDLVESAKKQYVPRPEPGTSPFPLRIRAKGKLAEQLVPSLLREAGRGWDAMVEEIDAQDLVSSSRISLNGWLGPPWIKEGWFHAYLLNGASVANKAAKREAEAIYRRLLTDASDGEADRLNLERKLVSLLLGGCERLVVGYTVRREYFNSSDYSEGVENVAYDSQAGLTSPIFIRTVKLKDFLWNGWLRLGVETRPRAAWNPIGGFTDAMGRLIWFTVGDPAAFPAPYSGTWVANRVTSTVTSGISPSGEVEVPKDALLPDPETGLFKPVGAGRTAKAQILYRVLASSFHDKTPMTVADVLYPFSFAYRWGVKQPQSRTEHDPVIEAATSLVRESLAGVRVLRVERAVKKTGEATYTFQVHIIEVYVKRGLADPRQVASVAPPWSSLPWHVVVLMEEAVKRGLAAFSAGEAKRRGVPWLDLVRDQAVKGRLAALVEEFRRQGFVPPSLKEFVTVDQARERWAALKQFSDTHRHFLVTNGPYRLHQWSGDSAVFQAFRDPTYPVGLGLFNRYPVPRKAFVSRMELHGDRWEIRADVETLFRFQRTYTIGREPLQGRASGKEPEEIPYCRYVVLGQDGRVLDAGPGVYRDSGLFSVDLRGKLKPGPYTIMVALYLSGNSVNPEVKVAAYRIEGRS